MTTPCILIVGSINMDLVLSISHLPAEGESMIGRSYAYIPGGKGANQAVAAARLGARVSMAGCLGDDANGHVLLENLRREGIVVAGVALRPDAQSGLAVIPVADSGRNNIVVIPGANMAVTPEMAEAALARDAYDAVMLQLEIPLETVLATIGAAKKRGALVVLDAGPAMSIPLEKLRGVDILSPNETEAAALTDITVDGEASAVRAAAALAQGSGAPFVVIKMSSKGALVFHDGQHALIPTYPDVKPVDSTAAGDSFTAAMAARMCVHGDIHKAVRYANAVGSICVSRAGAQPSLPTAAEVDAFLAAHGESTD